MKRKALGASAPVANMTDAVSSSKSWRKSMRIVIVAALATSMVLSPSLITAKPLSQEADIQRIFSGNTVSGEEKGVPYVEYFAPDGRIVGENRDGRYKGYWRIHNKRMCLAYDDDEDKSSGWECSQVGVDGSRLSWTDDGETTYSTIEPGNSHGL
jgi:hypothetical protein